MPLQTAIIGLLLVCAAPSALRAGSEPAAPLPVLTTIKAIRGLSQDEAARGYPVRVVATVTHFDEARLTSLLIHDGELGQWVMGSNGVDAIIRTPSLAAGDRIEVEGRTIRGGFAPNLMATRIRKIGRGPLPPPRTIPYSALLTGRHDCEFVEIEGVVQRLWLATDPHPLFAEIAVEQGSVRAAFWQYDRQDLDRLVDTRVRLRGNVGTIFGPTEQLRGVSLFAGRTRDIAVLDPAPDPFSLPTRPIKSLYNYSSAGEVDRRVRIRGVVTGHIPGRPVEVNDFTSEARFRYVQHVLFVRDGTAGAKIESEQPLKVRPGDVVEVAGFPAVTPGKPILKNAVFRVAGHENEPTPLTMSTPGGLVPENDAELVRMNANLLSVLSSPTERILVLRTGETVFQAGLDRDAAGQTLDSIRPGSLVSVIGVYSYQPGPPPSFRLVLRSPADVAIVDLASWWTLRHTAVAGALLVIAGSVAVLWAKADARRKRQEYQAVLSERTRLARELHDTLEQGLAGIALQLEAVAGSLPGSPEAAGQSLDVARQMLRYSIEETRRSVMDMRSQALERSDLPGALTSLARHLTTGTPTTATVRVTGEPQRLDVAQEHHLLRIGLEGLANALKHAHPRHIDIELRFRSTEADLVVRDDGCGLTQRVGMREGHFGLQGVRERVDKLGGRLRLDSRPGEGTELLVTIPTHRSTAMERSGTT